MAESMHRPTWLEVDLSALINNIQVVQSLHPNRTIWPVLKANAYHHGIGTIAATLMDVGIDHFCVSNLDEAIELQKILDKLNMQATILIFGDVLLEDIVLVQENWHITMSQLQWIEEALAFPFTNTLHVHIEVDSGMHRRGFQNLAETASALALLQSDSRFAIDGIYTHFAVADTDVAGTMQQTQFFESIVDALDYKFTHIHCANSSGSLLDVSGHCNGIRIGAIIYGIGISPKQQEEHHIQQIARLYSALVEVKYIAKGERISYNWSYEAQADEWIGILPIGYADGWIRRNQGRFVSIDGQLCEIIGRVCMDQMMIRLPKKLAVGTTVELFGKNIPLYKVANDLGTIDYEIICLLDERIMRTYIK